MRLCLRPAKLIQRCTFTVRFHHIHTMTNPVVNKTAHPFDKARLESVLAHRFFYAPAFEIYGGESLCFASSCVS